MVYGFVFDEMKLWLMEMWMMFGWLVEVDADEKWKRKRGGNK